MGDGFYRSKDPTNSIKVLKEQIVHRQIKHTISRHEHKTQHKSPSLQQYGMTRGRLPQRTALPGLNGGEAVLYNIGSHLPFTQQKNIHKISNINDETMCNERRMDADVSSYREIALAE